MFTDYFVFISICAVVMVAAFFIAVMILNLIRGVRYSERKNRQITMRSRRRLMKQRAGRDREEEKASRIKAKKAKQKKREEKAKIQKSQRKQATRVEPVRQESFTEERKNSLSERIKRKESWTEFCADLDNVDCHSLVEQMRHRQTDSYSFMLQQQQLNEQARRDQEEMRRANEQINMQNQMAQDNASMNDLWNV